MKVFWICFILVLGFASIETKLGEINDSIRQCQSKYTIIGTGE